MINAHEFMIHNLQPFETGIEMECDCEGEEGESRASGGEGKEPEEDWVLCRLMVQVSPRLERLPMQAFVIFC